MDERYLFGVVDDLFICFFIFAKAFRLQNLPPYKSIL